MFEFALKLKVPAKIYNMLAFIAENRIAELMSAIALPSSATVDKKVALASIFSLDTAEPTGLKKKGVINISGVLAKSTWYRFGYEDYEAMLDKYMSDDSVSEIEIRIDSPGGMANGCYSFAKKVAEAAKKKPVIAYVSDGECLSAAYFSIVGATKIIASKSSDLIGCLGVMTEIQLDDGYFEKLRIKAIRIVSDNTPDKGIEFENVKKGDTEMFKDVFVNPVSVEFVNFVKAMRPQVKEAALTGRIYTAQDAVSLGLIDEVVYYPYRELAEPVAATEADPELFNNNITNTMFNKLSASLISLMAYFGFSGENVNEKGLVEMSAEQLGEWKAKLEGVEEAKAKMAAAQEKLEALTAQLAAKDAELSALHEQVAARTGQPVALLSDSVSHTSDESEVKIQYTLK
jgi:ClpP class serine protease